MREERVDVLEMEQRGTLAEEYMDQSSEPNDAIGRNVVIEGRLEMEENIMFSFDYEEDSVIIEVTDEGESELYI